PLALAVWIVPACGDEVVHLVGPGPKDGAADVNAGPSELGAESPAEGAACANAASGKKVLNVPPDCHATICDGAGRAAGVVVAPSSVPTPGGPCAVGTCDALGHAGTAPVPAGTACKAAPSGMVCDGSGRCVECLSTRDCAPGLYCDVNHRCGSAPCTDL